MPPKSEMARPPQATHTIDRTPEYYEFIEKLRAFHADRGTTFDPEPKIGASHLDLLRVFKHIVANGGYDKISDEKLAWRRMAYDLGVHTNNDAATAFALKEKFYKFLAAYEIKTIHGREPPPKDILEDVTAKGSGLLKRTRENFLRPGRNFSVDSGEDGTPARDRVAPDTPGSSARASRGLREAPPQRVIFQPDTGPSRAPRHSSAQHAGPQTTGHTGQGTQGPQHHQPNAHLTQLPPGQQPLGRSPAAPVAGTAYNPNVGAVPSTVAGYNPRPPIPIALRPVDTPSTNPGAFSQAKVLAKARAAALQAGELPRVPPGTYDGANIYIRCLHALRSANSAERTYALHHWVRISFERGEKFRFEVFPGLDEGLVEAALRVGNLFYDVDWTISWDSSSPCEGNVLDGVDGTPDILERIKALTPKELPETIRPGSFNDEMLSVTEAVLTLRNMVTLPENALHLANFPPVEDLLCIVLSLPNRDTVVELKQYCLDIAEHITPFMKMDSRDPLYRVLLDQMSSSDRGVVLTSLRALGRISMNLDAANTLDAVPPQVLQSIVDWSMLNDDEFTDACLDFLYQYTAVVKNLDSLLTAISPESLLHHLARLLSHGARRVQHQVTLAPERRLPPSEDIAPMPPQLREELLRMPEGDRVRAWVRSFFDHDPESFITQIAAWQAYNGAFADGLKQSGQPATSPAEFIRMCSSIYQNSHPQVLTHGSAQQKFIIGCIRPRLNPVNTDGREWARCAWAPPGGRPGQQRCGAYFLEPEPMFAHILAEHLGRAPGEEGKYANDKAEFQCLWDGCPRRGAPPSTVPFAHFAKHIKTHALASFPADGRPPPAKKARKEWVVPARTMAVAHEETQMVRDEKNPHAPPQASGVPLSALFVLRNVARNIGKTEAEEELLKKEEEGRGGEPGGWKERLFRPLIPRFFEVMAENRALAPYMATLLELIQD